MARGSKKLKENHFSYDCPVHGKVTKGHLKTCSACRAVGKKKNGGSNTKTEHEQHRIKPRMGKGGKPIQV